jgi:hypothetical protein
VIWCVRKFNLEENKMATPVVKKCTCTSEKSKAAEYQDKKYGKGNRVMNPLDGKGFRCTICQRTVNE